jgi:NAD+ synthase
MIEASIVSTEIVTWLKQQLNQSGQKGFVIGVSGGIDSAVTSTLCAQTDHPVIVLNIPIRQSGPQFDLPTAHVQWLQSKYPNVQAHTVHLTSVFDTLEGILPGEVRTDLSMANTRSRLRMTALYAFANAHSFLVAGTGNKVEDFGIGFFTKYGDGGVDISPIADLVKSEVYELGRYLGIINGILEAAPTDGLWDGGHTDEDQIGASYDELEWAMDYCDDKGIKTMKQVADATGISSRQREVLAIYLKRHLSSQHKMQLPPVCMVSHKNPGNTI